MRLLIVALLALWPASSMADERLIPLLDWIVERTDYTYGDTLPTVRQEPYAYVEVNVYGPEVVAQAEHNGRELNEIHAYYNHDEDTIVFPDHVDPWSFEQRHTMVHELVHWLQDINGNLADCAGENEMEAYKLHWAWAQEHDHPSEEPSWLYVFLLQMACQKHNHHYWPGKPPHLRLDTP